MPRQCCVPGCKSNYDSVNEFVSTFSFSKDGQRKKAWIRSIRWTISSHRHRQLLASCILRKKNIIEEAVITRDDGTILKVKRDRPKLIPDAIPTIFSRQPKYLTNPPSTSRGGVLRSESVLENRDQKMMDEFMKNFDVFSSRYQEKFDNDCNEGCIFHPFYACRHHVQIPSIIVALKVFRDLSI